VAPDRGLATIDMRGRGHGSGVPAEMRFFQLWTFRDGRAVRMELYWDLDEARRAAERDP
jgi:ketosteroid isomerase-like protein